MRGLAKILVSVAFFALVLCAVPTQAQGLADAGDKLDNAGTQTGLSADLPGTVTMIVRGLLGALGAIFLILMVYAGFLWMTANGKEEQIETARKILTATIIGLFITLSAYGITYFIVSRLGGSAASALK